MEKVAVPPVREDIQHCVDACLTCRRACLETVAHGLAAAQVGTTDLIRRLLDAAEVCQTSADLMMLGSDLHSRTCEVCAEVCERTAQECVPFVDDVRIQACAETLRRCAEACREMAATAT